MSYLALYRKYRPSCFEEIVGQTHITKILRNSIITKQISHAFLFSGPRGTGKTSTAKIFAKTVNCLNPIEGERCKKCDVCKALLTNDLDVIEIDAASNNGVDEIREIRNSVKLAPSVGKYKIYIIDEVHMLSSGAFNALLKTLEEPPEHVIFILATTEIQKIPLTILSRCQRFDFKKINSEEIRKTLEKIALTEKKKLSKDVSNLIADICDGGLRDAINLLDQIMMNNDIPPTIDDIYKLNGIVSTEEIKQLFDNLISGDTKKTLKMTNNFIESGKNLNYIAEKVSLFSTNVNIYNNIKEYFSENEQKKYEKYNNFSNQMCNYIAKKTLELTSILKKTENQKLSFEIQMIQIINKINKRKEKIKNKRNQLIEIEQVKEKDNTEIISREIISVRINNSLATADKELLKEIKLKISNLSDYISNKEYNIPVNILMKGNVIVASKKYIMFEFLKISDINLFNSNIVLIEKFINNLLDKKLKVVAILSEEWKEIKKQYINKISNGEKYYLKSEPKIKEKIEKENVMVENIFGEESIDIK